MEEKANQIWIILFWIIFVVHRFTQLDTLKFPLDNFHTWDKIVKTERRFKNVLYDFPAFHFAAFW